MSNGIQKDVLTKTRVVYSKPEMDRVTVRRDLDYKTALTMDVYYPPGSNDRLHPAVIIVAGYPDTGHEKLLGCKFKETGSSASWATLIAACGIISVTYTNTEPFADFHSLLDFVHQHSSQLNIDATRIGLWASSGNVPLALSALIDRNDLKCAALLYGYTIDPKVIEMAKMCGFVNPCADKSMDDLPKTLPMFVARAGQDQTPYLNETLDRFIVNALACSLSITFANHTNGPHAFDLFDESHTTRVIIQQVLEFLNCNFKNRWRVKQWKTYHYVLYDVVSAAQFL
ncbi:hypothetical protein L0152_01040 [bacterium]|nr:hypothetical protein [bacterium]